MTTIALNMSDDLAQDISDFSFDESKSKSSIIIEAIKEYIEDYKDYKDAKKRLDENTEEYISFDDMKSKFNG